MSMPIVLLLSLLLLIPTQTKAQEPSVGISQIKTQGSTANDEFIELSNPAEVSINLSGYKMVKETTSGNQYTLLTFGQLMIEPRSYLLISQRDGLFAGNADALYGTALADNNRLYLLAPDAAVVSTIAWGSITGSTLANPSKDEVLARYWQEATQTWSSFQSEPFVQAHRGGDQLPASEPATAPTETEPTTPSATLKINEASLWAVAGDTAWVEIYNPSTATVDLAGWTIQTAGQSLAELSGAIAPGGYLVAFWPASNETTSLLQLYDPQGEIDRLNITSSQAPGTSLAIDAGGQLLPTRYATAGRPNLIAAIEAETPNTCLPSIEPIAQTPADETTQEIIAVSGRVRLNEIFANPTGDEASAEFIELYNEESFPIDLDGWSIADAAKTTVLANLRLEAWSYLLLMKSQSALTLNNSEETIQLADKTGAIVSEFAYETSHEDLSLNWSSGEWYEASPTPDMANAVQTVAPSQPATTPATNQTAVPAAKQPVTPSKTSPMIDEHSTMLRINEFLPNPTGSDDGEWIELYNPSDWNINLANISLADAAKAYALPTQTVMAHGFILISREESTLALNNEGDNLRLLASETVIDEINYESSAENQAWARDNQGVWQLTAVPTPGAANIFVTQEDTSIETLVTPEVNEGEQVMKTSSAAVVKKTEKPVIKKTPTKTKPPKEVDFVSWDEAKANENIALRGVLIAAPATFNEKTAYLQGEDGSGPGVELYFSKADWPTLDQGDILRVSGKKSAVKTGRRLLLSSGDNIEILDHTDLEAAAAKTEVLDARQHNTLVRLAGELAKNGKNDLALQDANVAISIKLSKASLAAPDLLPESTGEVTGIYRHGAKQELWPRDEADLVIGEILSEQTPPLLIAAGASEGAPWLSGLLVATAAILLGMVYFFKDRLLAYARLIIAFIRQRLAV